jgi:hypothetical protein
MSFSPVVVDDLRHTVASDRKEPLGRRRRRMKKLRRQRGAG